MATINLGNVRGPAGPTGPMGPAFNVDQTGTFANRVAYDAATVPFCYYATDTKLVYFRQGGAGVWTAGIPFGESSGGGVPTEDARILNLQMTSALVSMSSNLVRLNTAMMLKHGFVY